MTRAAPEVHSAPTVSISTPVAPRLTGRISSAKREGGEGKKKGRLHARPSRRCRCKSNAEQKVQTDGVRCSAPPQLGEAEHGSQPSQRQDDQHRPDSCRTHLICSRGRGRCRLV